MREKKKFYGFMLFMIALLVAIFIIFADSLHAQKGINNETHTRPLGIF